MSGIDRCVHRCPLPPINFVLEHLYGTGGALVHLLVILLLVLLVCVPNGLMVDLSVVHGSGVGDRSGVMHGLTIEDVVKFLLVGGEGITGSADLEADHACCENSACEVHFSVFGLVIFIIIN